MPGITVNLFPPFSDRARCRQLLLEASAPLSPEELLRLLTVRLPALAPYLSEDGGRGEAVALVVNGLMASSTDRIEVGDEVSVLSAAWGG